MFIYNCDCHGILLFFGRKKNNEGVKVENCYMSENKIV